MSTKEKISTPQNSKSNNWGGIKDKPEKGDWRSKSGLAQMLKGGVIMDVVNSDLAKIAVDAGAVSVMALERVPSDIRKDGGVARMSDPDLIEGILNSVSIPVMAKARIGHFAEAQILESMGVDYCDESEVLPPADNSFHLNNFFSPSVEASQIGEGAAMIRTKGEAGTGDIVQAVIHARQVLGHIKKIQNMPEEELMTEAKNIGAPYELILQIQQTGELPVVNFAAGGVATPADAALLMQIGVQGIFVGSGIFKSKNPIKMADAIVKATTHYNDPDQLVNISKGLGSAMRGTEYSKIEAYQQSP